MAKFKPGDKVVIRKNTSGDNWNHDMDNCVNKVATIDMELSFITKGAWAVKEFPGYYFMEDFLIPLSDVSVRYTLKNSKKKYTGDCPCGIHHSQCDYHKD